MSPEFRAGQEAKKGYHELCKSCTILATGCLIQSDTTRSQKGEYFCNFFPEKMKNWPTTMYIHSMFIVQYFLPIDQQDFLEYVSILSSTLYYLHLNFPYPTVQLIKLFQVVAVAEEFLSSFALQT